MSYIDEVSSKINKVIPSYIVKNNKPNNLDDIMDIYDSVPNVRRAIDNNEKSISLSAADVFSTQDISREFQQFRQGREAGEDYFETGISYMFMTKPNLNFDFGVLPEKQYNTKKTNYTAAQYNTMENGFFEYIARNYPEIMQSLSLNQGSTVPNFIPLLFNNFKALNFDDISLLDGNYNETYSGFSLRLPTVASQSMGGGQFNISYSELATPKITYLHKIWVEYVHKVKMGLVTPSMYNIQNKIIDYTSSVYYFTLAPDGETITFWMKFVGVVPMNIPYSSFGTEVGSHGEVIVNCTYLYSYKEYLQPESLQEFNDIFTGNKDILQIGKDLTMWQTALDQLISNKDESINPNNIPLPDSKSSVSGINMNGYKNLYNGVYNKAGIVKSGQNYKLIFYDA